MKPVLLEELKRIHEIMGSNPKIIMEAAGGPGPIAKFFEKLGVRSESEFDDLRRKVMNGNATEEEIYAFRAADDVMFNAQKTFDEVIEQNSDEIYEILMKNQDFLKLGRQVWLELNPTFEKVYNQIENIPNIERFTPDNLTGWKSRTLNTIEDLDLPEFVKQDLKSSVEDKFRKELPTVQKRLTDLLNSIKSEINELKTYVESTPDYLKLNNAQKVQFQDNYKRAKKLLDDLTIDDPQLEQKLKTLVNQFKSADPSYVSKVQSFLGDKYKKMTKTQIAIAAAVLCFTSLIPGSQYGCGWLVQTIFEKTGADEFKKGRESAKEDTGKTDNSNSKNNEFVERDITNDDKEIINYLKSKGYDLSSFTSAKVTGDNEITVVLDGSTYVLNYK